MKHGIFDSEYLFLNYILDAQFRNIPWDPKIHSSTAKIGKLVWSDNEKAKITELPELLKGTVLYRLPYEIYYNSSYAPFKPITISLTQPYDVYIAQENSKGFLSNGDLRNTWENTQEKVCIDNTELSIWKLKNPNITIALPKLCTANTHNPLSSVIVFVREDS